MTRPPRPTPRHDDSTPFTRPPRRRHMLKSAPKTWPSAEDGRRGENLTCRSKMKMPCPGLSLPSCFSHDIITAFDAFLSVAANKAAYGSILASCEKLSSGASGRRRYGDYYGPGRRIESHRAGAMTILLSQASAIAPPAMPRCRRYAFDFWHTLYRHWSGLKNRNTRITTPRQ